MTLAVDSSVLFDILLADEAFGETSLAALTRYGAQNRLVVCSIVYAEMAARLHDELESFLSDLGIEVDEEFTHTALTHAGRLWRTYAESRGATIQCPHCGHEVAVTCPSCSVPLRWRQHAVPDFLIGAHALHRTAALITRDRGFYRRYFQSLRLIEPCAAGPPPPP